MCLKFGGRKSCVFATALNENYACSKKIYGLRVPLVSDVDVNIHDHGYDSSA